MSVGFLNTGVTAINAANVGLSTTAHNISNATTAGFHRQSIVQAENVPLYTGAGFVGQGVHVSTVQRAYSQHLENQVLSAQTQTNHMASYFQQITQLDNMLADPNAGLSPALQEFYNGLNDVSANPASVPSRQSMISGADALVSRFQRLDERMTEIRNGINSQITASVQLINSYADQIAELNQRVVLADASGNGQPPNDLLDQREQLIAELNKEIQVSVVKQGDGTLNVFMGKGQALVVGQQAYALKAVPAPDDLERVEVAYSANNATLYLPSSLLTGGNLGGMLAFRSEVLDEAQNALGRVAVGLAKNFNDQHKLGQDLNGALGGDFFNVAAGQVTGDTRNAGTGVITATVDDVSALTTSNYDLAYDGTNYTLTRQSDGTQWTVAPAALPYTTADGFVLDLASGAPVAGDRWKVSPTRNGARDIAVLTHDTAKIAAAAPISTAASSANTGDASISTGSVNAPPPPNANLQQPVTITFTGPGAFNVVGVGTGNPVGVAYTSGGNISYNGWTLQISGTPAAGDVFTIGPNVNGVADNRNALLLGELATANTLAGGTASYQGAYSQLVSRIGTKSREVDVTAQAQETLLTQTSQKQQELSGVNLDEEAANLLRYQQAYQAASKMIATASQLFDDLLAAIG